MYLITEDPTAAKLYVPLTFLARAEVGIPKWNQITCTSGLYEPNACKFGFGATQYQSAQNTHKGSI
jgi:hypothetical protein